MVVVVLYSIKRMINSSYLESGYVQPRETFQHLLGPIWASFWHTKLKFHYVAPQFFIFRCTVKIAPNFLHRNAHIFLWFNPTGHSKFHNTSNHPPPATDSGRTARTLYPPVQAVPPYSLPHFMFLSWTEEPAFVGTCAHDRHALQQLALNVNIKHSELTWPDLTWPEQIANMFWKKLSFPHKVTSGMGDYLHTFEVLIDSR